MAKQRNPQNSVRGCAMCDAHKDKAYGQSVRKRWQDLKSLGKRKRVQRRDLGDVE